MRDPLALELLVLCQDLGISPADLLATLTGPAQPVSVPRPEGSSEAPHHDPAKLPASYLEATPNEALTTPEQYCSTPFPESEEYCSTVEKRNARPERRPITPAAEPTMFCTAANHLGEPCKARALKHTDRCYHHHPDTALEANLHSRRAGSAPRRVPAPDPLQAVDLSTPHGLRTANETLLRLALTGDVPTHRLNQAINALRMAYDHSPILDPRLFG